MAISASGKRVESGYVRLLLPVHAHLLLPTQRPVLLQLLASSQVSQYRKNAISYPSKAISKQHHSLLAAELPISLAFFFSGRGIKE